MPDRSTADTAGTAETVGTAAASDITRQVDALLDRSTDGIVMDSRDRRAVVLSRQTVYQGAVFDVEDMRIALPAGWRGLRHRASPGVPSRAMRRHARP